MSDYVPKKILVIDDEKAIRDSFRNFLEDLGYHVLEAENGKIGLVLLVQENPDLILVDLRMPEVDGLEVLRRVQKDSPDTPIVVVSGTGVIADVVEALRFGAWDYLIKPIEDLSVLLHAIEKALDQARLILENREYQKRLEERTIELEKALSEIKTLKGIVPICANCKKIRDDEGYWERVESYVQKHTDARFSHGICPACMRELYPELWEEGDDAEDWAGPEQRRDQVIESPSKGAE